MSAIKEFFQKMKVKAKFKAAGPGHALRSEAPAPAMSSAKGTPSAALPAAQEGSHSAATADNRHVWPMTVEQRKAAEAAAARAAAAPRGEPARPAADMQRVDARKVLEEEQRQVRGNSSAAGGSHSSKASAAAPDSNEDARLPLEVCIRYTCELLPDEKLEKHKMQARIEEYLTSQLSGEAPAMAAALMIHTLNRDADRVNTCVETLIKYFDNILVHPGDEKFTKIRASNKAFQERVASQKGALEFLQCAGFELKRLPAPAAAAAHADASVEAVAPDSAAVEDYYVLTSVSPERLTELKDLLNSAEAVRPQLDPDVRLYRVPNHGSTSRFRELPQAFYRISMEELKREQQARTEALEKAGMLRTRAMRERDEQRELRRYRYAVVRVRLPGNGDLVLQLLLHASDNLRALFDAVRACMRYDWLPFRLTSSVGGGELLDYERTLAELQLAPASVVNLVVDSAVLVDAASQIGSALEPGEIVKPELLSSARLLQ